jgi:hypothetical protein
MEQRAIVETARRKYDDLSGASDAIIQSSRDAAIIEFMAPSELARHFLAEFDVVEFPERRDWEQQLSIKRDAFVRANWEAKRALEAYESSGAKALVNSPEGLRMGTRLQELTTAANRTSQNETRAWSVLHAWINEGRRRASLWKER